MMYTNGKRKKFLDAALDIANQLVEDAVWYENRCTWMGNDVELIEGEWQVVYQTIDIYLYSGSAGIARFLMQCWKETQDHRFKDTALAAITHALFHAEQTLDKKLPIGLYDGLTGIVLVAVEINVMLNNFILSDKIKIIIDELRIRTCSNDDMDISDLLSGSAGTLVGLIKLSQIMQDTSFHRECHILAERLMHASYKTPYGWYWDQMDSGTVNAGLSGFAHGTSGISYALCEYKHVVHKKRYALAAFEGFEYEKTWFNTSKSNWADIRGIAENEKSNPAYSFSYPVFWCHGAGGIGLVRLRSYILTKDKNMLAEASAALHAAVSHAKYLIKSSKNEISPEINLSVCHGLGSIIDLFLYAYQSLENEIFLKMAQDIGAFSLSISHKGNKKYWRCGIHGGGETPGLMLGLAGIGYNFLKLYNPQVYHSPVGLEIS